MNFSENRVLVMWTILCIAGGVIASLASGALGHLLLGG